MVARPKFREETPSKGVRAGCGDPPPLVQGRRRMAALQKAHAWAASGVAFVRLRARPPARGSGTGGRRIISQLPQQPQETADFGKG